MAPPRPPIPDPTIREARIRDPAIRGRRSRQRKTRAREIVAAALQGGFYLSYPLILYVAHTRLSARSVGGILLGLYGASMLLRMRGSARDLWQLVRQHLPLLALIGAAIALANRTLLLLLPMLVSLYLLGTVAGSLRRGPPMIERVARAIEDDLPDFTLPYCRRVTVIWCGFLAANTVLVAALAFFAPLGWWALYTGVLFYGLLGTLLAAEFCVRKWWFRHYDDGLADRVFARLFPPERTANGRRSLAYVARREAAATTTTSGSAGTPATC
jgi:uncharacterized membrane protein